MSDQNPKSEYRNPKQTGAKINPKSGKSKTSNPIWTRFEFLVFGSFEFVSSFGFRASNFLFLASFAPLRESSVFEFLRPKKMARCQTLSSAARQ
jgi:hypothetical protein